MISAIGSRSVVSTAPSSGGSDSAKQIAALQEQITGVQEQLKESQKGEQTDASKKVQKQLAQQIQLLQALIAQLQAQAAQQAGRQRTRRQGEAPVLEQQRADPLAPAPAGCP